jgi:agmatinase
MSMIKSIINATNIDDADMFIIQAPYEHTASSRKGTKYGPQKIIECLENKLEFFDRDFLVDVNERVRIAKSNDIQMDDMTPDEALECVVQMSQKAVRKNKFPLLLGGEHSVSLGLLKALAETHNPRDVTVLQIDAHCDLRQDDSDYSDNPSPLAHSCVMRRCHELGYNILQVGIRTYSRDEYEYFTNPQNKITVFEWRRKYPTIEEIVASIKTQKLYITIDVDGFDPAFMPGTGTPVQGGLDWWYGLDLVRTVVRQHDLIGADIVEVAPMSESVLTEYGASQLAYTIISNKFLK